MKEEKDSDKEKEKEKKWDVYGNRNKNYRDQRSIKIDKEKVKEVVYQKRNVLHPKH